MRYVFAIIVAVFLATGGAQPTLAQGTHNCARQALASGRIVPLGQILHRVRQRVRGRMVGVRLLGCPRGPFIYRVRMLTFGGRIAVVTANARTGRILGVSGGAPVYRRPQLERRPDYRRNRRLWYRKG
ncbi:MAG: hypothetical protein OEQ29_21110, partial [Alphaproteobacteria bacterium]|nr:hypothetical protein [Alphaproteobacteria bacterium]